VNWKEIQPFSLKIDSFVKIKLIFIWGLLASPEDERGCEFSLENAVRLVGKLPMPLKKVNLRLPCAPQKEENGKFVPSLDVSQVGHKEVRLRGFIAPFGERTFPQMKEKGAGQETERI